VGGEREKCDGEDGDERGEGGEVMEGGDADVDDLRADGAKDAELEDEEGEGGQGEGDDVELNEAQEWGGHDGVSADDPGDAEGEIEEEAGGIEPGAAHGPEGEGDGEGAEGEQAVDAPPGARGVVRDGAEREKQDE
jgi:hypothetical protein